MRHYLCCLTGVPWFQRRCRNAPDDQDRKASKLCCCMTSQKRRCTTTEDRRGAPCFKTTTKFRPSLA